MSDRTATADILIQARRDGAITELPGIPATIDEAYAALDAVSDRIGEAIVGWKAAFTNDAAMAKMKTDEPAFGPLFEPWVFRSGATVATPANCLRLIESEYAFMMGRDLPARDAPYSQAEVSDAVASAHPALEVAHSRLAGAFEVGARALIADHCANFAFAYGDGLSDWRGLDFLGQTVTLAVDGETVASGAGADVMGHPVASLTWLANKLSSRGVGLKSGQILTTGTCTGMNPVARVCTVAADFGPLGACSLTLTA